MIYYEDAGGIHFIRAIDQQEGKIIKEKGTSTSSTCYSRKGKTLITKVKLFQSTQSDTSTDKLI